MPDWKSRIKLDGVKLTPEREAEIAEELDQHLDDHYASLVADGVPEPEALRRTLEELNNKLVAELGAMEGYAKPEIVPEKTRFLAGVWQDFRYAMRMLKRNPGFSALAVLSLAIGIGGNAAIFGILSAVLIQPLPYPHANRLMRNVNDGYYPPGAVVALQRQSKTMDIAGFQPAVDLNLAARGQAWRLTGSSVSANLFSVLGSEATMGRAFRAAEDQPGKDSIVILSHSAWKQIFGADPEIAGKVFSFGGVDRQVVGVMPPGFSFPDSSTQFWIPLHLDSRDQIPYWNSGFMPIMARLRDGATIEQAQQELRSLNRGIVPLFPYLMPPNWNAQVELMPMQLFLVKDVRLKLILLQAAVGALLLITCANVANLLLARAATRQKEMAVRTALGASRFRIVRQLLTESMTLALTGGALGILFAFSLFYVLNLALPSGTVDWSTIRLRWQVLAFISIVSVMTGLAFGLAPALSTLKEDLAGAIKTGSQRSAGTAKTRVRGALIIGEVALAVLLAVSAGLLLKSLWMLAQVNPGFDPEHILTLRVSPNQSLCRERSVCIAFFNELLRRSAELPGVRDAAAANTLPLSANIPAVPVVVEGHPLIPGVKLAPMFWAGAVTPSYFRLMGIKILQGRPLADADGEKSEPVVVINAATAHRYWPGENPIGKHVRLVFETRWRTVVGIAADVRQYDLANHSPDYIEGAVYMPYPQSVVNDRRLPGAMTMILRTGADPTQIVNRMRELVATLNPDVPVSEVRTMDSLVNDSTQQPRSMTWLFASFASTALFLAAIGTYGVVSYSTAQRTFEIGMRVALGASRRNIFGLVLGQSFRLIIVGLVVGIAASFALTRMLSAFLYGTAATDPLIFSGVCVVLAAIALLAGYVPARRAASIDPLIALRVE